MSLIQSFKKIIKSKLIKDTGVYAFFKVFDKLIPFFILPIITRVLSPEEFGVFVLFQALAGIALPLVTLSVDSSILLNFFKIDKEKFSNYFSSGYLLILISTILLSATILIFQNPISEIANFPAGWVSIILLFVFFQFHSNLALNFFQVKKEARKYGIYSLSLTALKNFLMLILVLAFGMKWQGMIIGYLSAYSLFFVISLFLFSRNNLFTTHISKEFILDNMKVGFPLSLHQIGSWLASSSTRIIVSGLLGAAATGSFGIGASIGTVVLFIQDSFNKAFVPYLFENLNKFNSRIERKLIKITYIYNIGLLLFSLVIGILGFLFLVVIFGSAYSEGKDIVLLIALAYAFDGMYKMHVNYIFYSKKTHFIFLITMTTGLLNILFSYIFIDLYGLIGGALSLCLINLIGYLLSWYIGNRVIPMNWFRFAIR